MERAVGPQVCFATQPPARWAGLVWNAPLALLGIQCFKMWCSNLCRLATARRWNRQSIVKKQNIAISIFGVVSLLAGGTTVLSSFVTFHPSILESAKWFMAITAIIWAVSLLITLFLSLTVVPFADDDEVMTARLLRRRGLWYSLPQIAVFLFFVVAGLLLARDIASMGGH